jgi:hypothetical protein
MYHDESIATKLSPNLLENVEGVVAVRVVDDDDLEGPCWGNF